MIHLQVSENQRRELHQVSRQAVGRVALRAQMVLLCARDYTVPQIAVIHDCGEDVVRTWIHRYEQDGIAGLDDELRSGRPLHDPLAPQIVDTQASQSPRCAGYVQSCWTVTTLTTFVAVHFRLVLSRDTVRRYLRALGWRWARPRLAPARKQDPAAEAKLAALAVAHAEVVQGTAHLLYLDECDLHLLPVLRAMWMKGPRVRVPTPGTNAKRAFFGALDAASGRVHTSDHDRKLAIHFTAFLQTLADAYPTGILYLAMDNVTMHDAKVVRAWRAAHPQVRVLWLPTYAAHTVNPIERIWGLMKDDVAANRLADTMEELTQVAQRFFRALALHPMALPFPALSAPIALAHWAQQCREMPVNLPAAA